MLIKLTVPGKSVNADVLGRALEAATAIAETQVESLPPLLDLIQTGEVVWKAEPAGQGYEGFDMPVDVVKRGWGDCDDLAPWWAAHLRTTGEDEGARAVVYPSGPNRWHAVVERSSGAIDDPSRWAGMGRSQEGARAPVEEPLVVGADGAPADAMQMSRAPNGMYVCRIDLACSHCDPQGLSVRASSPTVLGALEKATENAFRVAVSAEVSQESIDRVWALLAALHGWLEHEIEQHLQAPVPAVVGAVCDASLAGDGILSTIFDPLGFHHLLDPVIDPLLAPRTTQQGGRMVTTQIDPRATDILHALIGHSGTHMGPYPPDYFDFHDQLLDGPGPRVGGPVGKWQPATSAQLRAQHMAALKGPYAPGSWAAKAHAAAKAAYAKAHPGSASTPSTPTSAITPAQRAAQLASRAATNVTQQGGTRQQAQAAAAAAYRAANPDWAQSHDARRAMAAAARAAQADDGGDDDGGDDDGGGYDDAGDWDDGEA